MDSVRISFAFAGAALRAEVQYRLNLLVGIGVGLAFQITGFLFIWVVLSRFHSLGGWSLGDIAFLYGLRLTAHGLWLIPLNRLVELDEEVRQGRFDVYLVRPLNPLLQFTTIRFRINVLGDVVGGVVLFAAATRLVGIDWSPPAVGYLALALIGGAALEGSLQLACSAMAFRWLDTWGLRLMLDDVFSNFGNYPLHIFGGVSQWLLTFVLPLAFVAYLPATVLLHRTAELSIHPLFAYLAPLVGAACFIAACCFWMRQMRNYQSSGH